MKTAISIDDGLLQEADETARLMGLSRSRLFALAVGDFLITSNLSRANAPGNVLLKKGEADLPKASVVNVSQILTVDKAELVEFTGNLSAAAAGAVRDGLHLLFDRL